MSDLTYKLSIDSKGIFVPTQAKPGGDDSGATPLTVANGGKSKITYGNMTMELSLYGLSFNRKIYEPGHIQAELLITKVDGSAPSLEVLSQLFIHRPVSLSASFKAKLRGQLVTSTVSLASGYYIHEISPQYEREKVTMKVDNGAGRKIDKEVDVHNIYMKLDIFSLDKLLTLNKYSQTHLGKKLITDIVDDTLGYFPLQYKTLVQGVSSTETVSLTFEKRELSNLHYPVSSSSTNKDPELIHPYLVQYNETFYDFLRRVTNRCGEPFYFEDGKLIFGVNNKLAAYTITSAKRVIYQRVSGNDLSVHQYARDDAKEWIASSFSYKPKDDTVIGDPIPMDDSGYPAEAFPKLQESVQNTAFPYSFNSELATEEQYIILYKDKFARDSMLDLYMGDSEQQLVAYLSDILNSTDLMELVVGISKKLIEGSIKAGIKAGKDTKAGNQTVEDNALSGITDYAVLLAKVDAVKQHWITLKYYSDIRSREEQQMRGMVCIDMADGLWVANLGDKIRLPNDNQTYVVVQVDMTAQTAWQRTYESFFSDGKAPAAVQSQRIYAVPLYNDKFYPPVIPEPPFRQSGPQPAFVLDSKDPTSQGRVRIRFGWEPSLRKTHAQIQEGDDAEEACKKSRETLEKYAETIKEDSAAKTEDSCVTASKKSGADKTDYDNALKDYKKKYYEFCKKDPIRTSAKARLEEIDSGTPWIRMATPMATPGGGMYFRPEAGDEVMVDFENGNIERPYVVGTLYSKNVRVPQGGGNRCIVSKNGHTIKLSDPSDANLLTQGLLPGLGFLSSYGVDWQLDGLKGKAAAALGGIELTDTFGLYDIKMSSHDRKISIASPFGNVEVSALTGISIQAPNGDISITGKNVDISAYNNVTIQSGKNILAHDKGHDSAFSYLFSDDKTAGKLLGKTFANMVGGKLLDLSIIRTLLEIFIRPVDGTLQIKSNRYLQLEAGEGAAGIEESNYKEHFWEQEHPDYEAKILVKVIEEFKKRMDSFVDGYVSKYNAVRTKCNMFPDSLWAQGAEVLTKPADRKTLLYDMFDLVTDQLSVEKKSDDYYSKVEYGKKCDAAAIADFQRNAKDYLKELMLAVLNLKRHIESYLSIYDNLNYKSFAPGGKWYKFKADHKTFPPTIAKDIKKVLTLDNPIVPRPNNLPAPIPVVAGNPLQYSAPQTIDAVKAIEPDQTAAPPQLGLYGASIKRVMEFYQKRTWDDNDPLFAAELDANDFVIWKTFVLRRIYALHIEKCRSVGNPFNYFSIAPAKYEPVIRRNAANNGDEQVKTAPVNMAFPFADTDWVCYVNEIKLIPPPKFLSGLKAGVMGAVSKLNPIPLESVKWKPEAKGQILFSDAKGKSYRFNGGTIEGYEVLSDLGQDTVDLKAKLLIT